jgi:hypothetical protein
MNSLEVMEISNINKVGLVLLTHQTFLSFMQPLMVGGTVMFHGGF